MRPPRNRLWAPWRLAYIKGPKTRGCFLCAYAKSRGDAGRCVVRRGKRCLCVINLYPYNNGHLMVAPQRHVGRLEDLKEEEMSEMWRMTTEMKQLLDRTLHPHGYNIGINLGRLAGAGLPGHIHVHVVPRWGGDTNYMAVVGNTKVLPMSLKELRRVLTEADRAPQRPRNKRAT